MKAAYYTPAPRFHEDRLRGDDGERDVKWRIKARAMSYQLMAHRGGRAGVETKMTKEV